MPSEYTLGTGHVRFFYARLGYVSARHAELVREMIRRGYRPQFSAGESPLAAKLPDEWYAGWEPDERAMAVNRARIAERLASK
jgi:deoxyribonuclease (pyrimidine dimer)